MHKNINFGSVRHTQIQVWAYTFFEIHDKPISIRAFNIDETKLLRNQYSQMCIMEDATTNTENKFSY